MTQDFGELAFGGIVELDSQAKEILAAGWRNLWNISMMLAGQKHEKKNRLSCYTLDGDSDIPMIPFDVESDENDSEDERALLQAQRYERYRN